MGESDMRTEDMKGTRGIGSTQKKGRQKDGGEEGRALRGEEERVRAA